MLGNKNALMHNHYRGHVMDKLQVAHLTLCEICASLRHCVGMFTVLKKHHKLVRINQTVFTDGQELWRQFI